MSRIKKKWFKDFLFSNLDDTAVVNPIAGEVIYLDGVSGKWENGDTSNVLLLTPTVLSRELFVPANKVAIMNSFRAGDNRIKVEGRLRVL